MWFSWKLLFGLLFVNKETSAGSMVEIFAYNGRDAKVSCSYAVGYESYEKYLCSENCGNGDVLVTTTEGRKNRYSITDDSQRQIFTVTISNVGFSDAGKYWCGVTRSGKDFYTEVNVHINADDCCESAGTIQSYEDNNVSISCPYQPEFVNNLKYLCKAVQPSTCLQQALVTTNTKQNGRFTLKEEQNEFTVDITGVTKQDAGAYLCGIEKSNSFHGFSRVDLTVREWCCVTSHDVKGLLGQSVTLQCPYPTDHVSNIKFLCKGERRHLCQTLVSSEVPTDRFKLQQNHSSSSFSVTITGLGTADAGTYWCGSNLQWTPNKNYTKIHLSVEWCCVTSHDVKGVVGQSVTLQCPYPSQHVSNRKFLCKGDHRDTCQTVVPSVGPKDRLKLREDHSSSSFSVIITGLGTADAGTYWCGSDAQWTPNTYTKIQLSVDHSTVTVSPTQTININVSPSTYNTDAVTSHIVLYVVPAILLMLIAVTSIIVYKYCCVTVQEGRENSSSSAKEDIEVSELYNNQEVVNNYRRGDDLSEQQEEALYENFSNKHIYSNY